jgi:hypothetical protein
MPARAKVAGSGHCVRHGIAVCLLLGGCTTAHSPNIGNRCELYPSDEWKRLPTPPPDAREMLDLIKAGTKVQLGKQSAAHELWFGAEDGGFRFCRYGRATDPCHGIPEVIDFQFYYGKWNVVGGGLETICVGDINRSVR